MLNHRRLRIPGLAAALAALVAALFSVSIASAHPLGNFTVNRYARIELYRDQVQLHYTIDMAEIPTFQLIGALDTDKDGVTSQEELEVYGARARGVYPQAFTLAIDGKQLEVAPVATKIQLAPGQGGLQVLRLAIVYSAPVSAASSAATVTFEDRNFTDRQGWKEIVIRPSEGANATIDPALLVEQSKELLEYPAESLTSAPDMTSVSFGWVPGTGGEAPETTPIADAAPRAKTDGFANLINRDTSDAWLIVFSLLAAFGFGMIHALGPGHGKTVVAAYLVGSKGTVRHAVALGATVTATHTSTVYIVGFIALAASSEFATEKVQLYIGVAAGAMIIAMGLSLFLGRLWKAWKRTPETGLHRHGIFGKAHSHLPAGYEPAHAEHHAHPHAAALPTCCVGVACHGSPGGGSFGRLGIAADPAQP